MVLNLVRNDRIFGILGQFNFHFTNKYLGTKKVTQNQTIKALWNRWGVKKKIRIPIHML